MHAQIEGVMPAKNENSFSLRERERGGKRREREREEEGGREGGKKRNF